MPQASLIRLKTVLSHALFLFLQHVLVLFNRVRMENHTGQWTAWRTQGTLGHAMDFGSPT